MTTRAFYQDWHLQDAGAPFSIGDHVEWGAVPFYDEQERGLLGEIEEQGVEWEIEAPEPEPDDPDLTIVSGTVTAIRAIRQRFETYKPGYAAPVPGDVIAWDLQRADGREGYADPGDVPYQFRGYVVTVD